MKKLLLLLGCVMIAGIVYAETDYIAIPRIEKLEKVKNDPVTSSNWFASATYKASINQYSGAYVDGAVGMTNFTPTFQGQLLMLPASTSGVLWVGTNTVKGQWVKVTPNA